MGAPLDVIAAARANHSQDDQVFEVFAEEWQTLEVFLLLSRCWVWLSGGLDDPVRVGIPAQEIESTLRMVGIKKRDRRRMFADIRVMEEAALDAIATLDR